MYPILFIGKKQIKTDLFCANHKLHLTRPGAWESMARLLAFPGTLLNMVESWRAGVQPAFSLFLGMVRMGLVDLGRPAVISNVCWKRGGTHYRPQPLGLRTSPQKNETAPTNASSV